MSKKDERKKGKTRRNGGPVPKWFQLDMPNNLDAVEGWCKQGYTNAEMAAMLGISEELLYKWQRDYPEFKAALRKGKNVANGELVNAAFRNATGYYIQVTEPMKIKRQKNVGTELKPFWVDEDAIEMVTYNKYIPANATQSIFMLKNRLPEQYRDKQEIKQDITQQVVFVETELDD